MIILDLAAKESIVMSRLLLQCFFDISCVDFFRLCFLPTVVASRLESGWVTPTKLIVIFLGGIERPLLDLLFDRDLSVFAARDSFRWWSVRKD